MKNFPVRCPGRRSAPHGACGARVARHAGGLPVRLLAWGLAGALGLGAAAATAQVKAAPAESESAAMERVRRQAANPLRMILEASRSRRSPAAADTAAEPAGDTRAGSRVSSASASAEGARPIAARQQAQAASPGDGGGIVVEITFNAQSLPARLPQAEHLADAPGAVLKLPRLDRPSEPPPVPAPFAPTLLRAVDPRLSGSDLSELGGRSLEVTADLTLAPDGTVSAVNLLPPVPRALVRPLTLALQQWVYAPVGGELVHRVRLVLQPPG